MHKVTFANISVTSEKMELFDYADVFKNAFFASHAPRKTVSATYQFVDVAFGQLGADISSFSYYGRLVKNTTLVREQVLQNGKLVPMRTVLPSSPSAFFVFNLLDHRMALMAETQNAPSVRSFGNTLKFFLFNAYEKEVRQRFSQSKETNEPLTLKAIREAFPKPIVDIIPIADKIAISTFLGEFEKINQVVVHVTRRNQDLRHGELFDDLAEEVAPLGASSSKFVISGGTQGLDRGKTTEFIQEVVNHGYEDTKISGKDKTGAKITGTNEDYSLVRELRDPPSDTVALAERIHQEYVATKELGQIRVENRTSHETLDRLEEIKRKHG